MKFILYKILLFLLQGLIYLKRILVWLLQQLWLGLMKVWELYRNTIGIHFYKLWFSLKKKTTKFKVPSDSRFIEFLGKRSTLQVVLFLVAIIVMIPHSKIYTREAGTVAGQQTILYKLIGPGDQDFGELEDISVDVTTLTQTDTRSWREGAVVSETPGTAGADPIITQQEISSISAGGTAVSKPTIAPGAELPTPTVSGEETTGRKEIIVYEVQPGDMIGKIAEKFSVSVVSILWANGLSERSLIRPGDQLKILPVDGVVHTVKSGDTVSKIARTYDAEADAVIKFNKLQNDGSDIVVGEELIIPNGTMPQAVVTYTPTTRRYTSFSEVTAPPPSVAAPAGSGYLWPTSIRKITQYYGWRHTGLDIAGPVGTPLYASRAGTVIKSQCGWNGGYGCYVIIDHGGGVQTLYGHASQLYVSVGQGVAQGQTIAAMGSTGRSTGPHIHFEVRVNGARLNPLQYIR